MPSTSVSLSFLGPQWDDTPNPHLILAEVMRLVLASVCKMCVQVIWVPLGPMVVSRAALFTLLFPCPLQGRTRHKYHRHTLEGGLVLVGVTEQSTCPSTHPEL